MRKAKGPAKSCRTEPRHFAVSVDLYDYLTDQLDRLRAVATLMTLTTDALDAETTVAVGSLLKDLHERMEVILDEPRRKISTGS